MKHILQLLASVVLAGCASVPPATQVPKPPPFHGTFDGGEGSVLTNLMPVPLPPSPTAPSKPVKALVLPKPVAVIAGETYVISNPPPVVELEWDPPAAPPGRIAGYNVYYGVSSGLYTNVSSWQSTNATITLSARGVTFYFAATTLDTNSLESVFSNEISWMAPAPLDAPGMHPPIALTVETAQDPLGPWRDAGMAWTLATGESNGYFRLRIVKQ